MSSAERLIVGLSVLLAMALGAQAAPIQVGSGASTATVVIEFQDTATYEFAVLFDGPQTGLGLFDIIEASVPLTTERQDFGFGVFIDGISYDGHTNSGYAGGEDWWHYYTYDFAADGWVAPSVGALDRPIGDGDRDGWVYGRSWATVPEPASLGLLGVGCLALIRRRK